MDNYTCEKYCEKSSELSDPVVLLGSEKTELKADINNLRNKRWALATLQLDKNSKPVVKIIDEKSFEASCKEEADKLKKLSEYVMMFNNLNTLFEEIQKKHPRIKSPTLAGLKDLRHSYSNDILTYEGRIKNALVNKLTGYRTTGKTADQIITDQAFVATKAEYEELIKQTQAKLAEINNYINQVKKIVEGV